MVARSEEQLAIDVIVRDALTAEMRRMGLSVEKFEKSTNRPLAKTGARFDTLSTKALSAAKSFGTAALAAAALGAAYSAIRGASQFGKAIAEVSTLVDTQRVNMGQLSDEILKLAAAQNQSELVVAKGVYQALSAGVSDANEALKLTNEAAKLAVAGVSDTASAVDLLTTVVNAYGLEAAEAARISDVLFKTVQLGKTTVPELASSLGQVVPIAASLGVSIEEVAAAVATLTLQGVSTSEAVTQVRATLVALLKNGDDVDKAFASIGKSFEVGDVASRGLVNTLLDLRDATGGSEAELTALLGRVEAVNATLGLTQNAGAKAASTLKDLENSAGATGEAFDKQMSAPVNVLSTVFNAARIKAVEFGQKIVEMLARVVQRFQSSKNLNAAFERLIQLLEFVGDVAIQTVENGLNLVIDTLEQVFAAAGAVNDTFTALGATWQALPIAPLVGDLRDLGNVLGLISGATEDQSGALGKLSKVNDILKASLTPIGGGPTKVLELLFADAPEEAKAAGEESGVAFAEQLTAAIEKVTERREPLVDLTKLIGPGSVLQDAVQKAAVARKLDELRAGLDTEVLRGVEKEVKAREQLISLRLEEARAAFRAREIDAKSFAAFRDELEQERQALAAFRAERELALAQELEFKVRIRVLEGDDSLAAQLQKQALEGLQELTVLKESGASPEFLAAVQTKLAAEREELIFAARRKDLDERDARARQEAADAAAREAENAERVLQARQDERRAYAESERLQAALEGGIDGRLQLQQLATKERINNLRELADQGVLTAEAFRELFGIVVELGQQDRLRLIDETTLSQAQLAADAVALVTNRLEDRLDAIRAADAFERNRAQEVAKDYTDEAAALESLNAQIDAQTAALVQQEVIRDRERSGEEIQRWERVREAIARVNAEVAAGNVTLSERQMFLIETIRQMEVEANTLRQGFQAGFEDFSQYAGNLAAQGQRAASDVAYGFSNNLGTAIFDIGRDFKNAGDAAEEFGRRTLESIAQIAAQLAALQIVKSGLGFLSLGVPGAAAGGTAAAAASPPATLFAKGGVARGGLGDLNPVYGYADGGPIVRKPHTAVIGEGKYDEAIVPLPDGRSIPVEMRSGGRQGEAPISVTQTFNFTVQADRRPGDRGQLALDPKTIRQIQDAVASGMAGGNQNLRAAVRGVK